MRLFPVGNEPHFDFAMTQGVGRVASWSWWDGLSRSFRQLSWSRLDPEGIRPGSHWRLPLVARCQIRPNFNTFWPCVIRQRHGHASTTQKCWQQPNASELRPRAWRAAQSWIQPSLSAAAPQTGTRESALRLAPRRDRPVGIGRGSWSRQSPGHLWQPGRPRACRPPC